MSLSIPCCYYVYRGTKWSCLVKATLYMRPHRGATVLVDELGNVTGEVLYSIGNKQRITHGRSTILVKQ